MSSISPRAAYSARSLALPAAWLIGVVAIAISGCATNQYLLHVRGIPEPHPYPLEEVAVLAGIATFECLVVWAILRPRSYLHSWLRALCALAFTGAATVLFALGLMHAPLHLAMHVMWLACGWLALLGLTIGSAATALRAR